MAKIGTNFPTLTLHRDSFTNERTFREVQQLVQTIESGLQTLAASVNESYAGDIASSGGVTGSRPAAPRTYQQYYDTTISNLVLWDGSNWVDTEGNIS